jgi:hypothetical protein
MAAISCSVVIGVQIDILSGNTEFLELLIGDDLVADQIGEDDIAAARGDLVDVGRELRRTERRILRLR